VNRECRSAGHASRFVIYLPENLLSQQREAVMAKLKVDGVVQAVRYDSSGQIAWVRAYLRRGPTWSDVILVDRQTLVNDLKAGKQYYTGRRVPFLAGTFETQAPVRILEKNGREVVVAGEIQADTDCLAGVPLV
jgi:hypothetical protein